MFNPKYAISARLLKNIKKISTLIYVYAMSSVCVSTNEDKSVVLSECYRKDVNLLAQNVVKATNMAKSVQPFEWKVDPTAN